MVATDDDPGWDSDLEDFDVKKTSSKCDTAKCHVGIEVPVL